MRVIVLEYICFSHPNLSERIIYIFTILRGPCSIHIYDSDITFKSCRGCEVVDYCASDSDTPVHVNMCLCP